LPARQRRSARAPRTTRCIHPLAVAAGTSWRGQKRLSGSGVVPSQRNEARDGAPTQRRSCPGRRPCRCDPPPDPGGGRPCRTVAASVARESRNAGKLDRSPHSGHGLDHRLCDDVTLRASAHSSAAQRSLPGQTGSGISPRAAAPRDSTKRAFTGSDQSNDPIACNSLTFVANGSDHFAPRTSMY
jgi:hypothetical protein